ncbi:MAG: class I SAM-dependent methyltransferase [Actinomycetota bacterium]
MGLGRFLIRRLIPVAALGGLAAAAASVLRQRRNPEPFPASQARLLDNPIARASARKTVELMGLAPGMRVLDVGAGIGRISLPAAKLVAPDGIVVALDIQQEMLDLLGKRAADAGVGNIESVRAGAGDGVIVANSFDRAILSSVLGEIPEERRRPALQEVFDALKPGGVLFVSEVLAGDPHFQTRRATRELGESVGFEARSSRRGLGHLTELVKPAN